MEHLPGSNDPGGGIWQHRGCTRTDRAIRAGSGARLSPFMDGYCCGTWLRKQQNSTFPSLLWPVHTGGSGAPVDWARSTEKKRSSSVKLLDNAAIYTTVEEPIRETVLGKRNS
jgi:hypothetical protein